MLRVLLAILVLAGVGSAAQAQEPGTGFETLYRVTLLRAAPGQFNDLLGDMKNRAARHDYHILRHSQGDHWDFMTLEPLGSYAAWFDPKHANRQVLDAAWREHLDRLASYRSEWFVFGPDHEQVKQGVENNDLYHVEMFRALAGHKIKLLRQRAMENDYLKRTKQVVNLVFKGDQGGDWDVMTIGFHKSLKRFAEGSPMTPEQKDEVARQVGFQGVSDIGPYLRSLLESHNDTLAVSVD